MCATSAVSDYYTRIWPTSFPNQPVPSFPNDVKLELLEILKRLDKIDKKLKDVDCIDESKVELAKILQSIIND